MSFFSLVDKVALVTGGNGGLGLAMAIALHNAGARVAIAGRNPEKLKRAKALLGTEASTHVIDLNDDNA